MSMDRLLLWCNLMIELSFTDRGEPYRQALDILTVMNERIEM